MSSRRPYGGGLLPNRLPDVTVLLVQAKSAHETDFSWTSWFLDKMAGPLAAGLIIAALGSWWIAQVNERYRGRREHMSKSVDALRSQVEAAVRVSSEYWSVGYSKKSPGQAAEIQYKLDDIDALTRICASQLWKDQSDEGPKLVGALFSAILAPGFGSTTKIAQPQLIEQIVRAGSALTEAVAQSRHDYLSAGLLQRVGERLKAIAPWVWAEARRPKN